MEAARVCLAERGIEASELEAIIVATVTPDMMFPSTACLVQHKLGAQNVWGFDVSAACCAFVYALQVGTKLIESGAHKKVMVIGADVMSSIIDYKDRATCIIFGDGAGAVLLEPAEEGEVGMIDYLHEIDGSGAASLYMPGGGSLHPPTAETVAKNMHVVHQDGQAVYKFAVRKMSEATEALLVRNGIHRQRLGLFYSAPGEQAHYPVNGRAVGDRQRASHYQYRPLRQHHCGYHSPGHADGAGREQAASRATWCCWRLLGPDIPWALACCAGKFNRARHRSGCVMSLLFVKLKKFPQAIQSLFPLGAMIIDPLL